MWVCGKTVATLLLLSTTEESCGGIKALKIYVYIIQDICVYHTDKQTTIVSTIVSELQHTLLYHLLYGQLNKKLKRKKTIACWIKDLQISLQLLSCIYLLYAPSTHILLWQIKVLSHKKNGCRLTQILGQLRCPDKRLKHCLSFKLTFDLYIDRVCSRCQLHFLFFFFYFTIVGMNKQRFKQQIPSKFKNINNKRNYNDNNDIDHTSDNNRNNYRKS